jgi:plasmid stability protein
MKNITVTVPEEVYRRARIRAAEQGRSVSALVADYLRSLADDEAEFARLEAMQKRVMAEIVNFDGSDRLSRDDVHDRALR